MGVVMDKKLILILAVVFSLGFIASSIFGYVRGLETQFQNPDMIINSSSVVPNTLNVDLVIDKPSPKGRVSTDNIFVYDNEVVMKIDNPQWAIFADSKSMDPVIDSDSKAIEIEPKTEDDVQLGDIVAYESKIKNGVVIHRVVEINYDSKGWYALMKGDNNPYNDPEKVRFSQVKRIVVAIIY